MTSENSESPSTLSDHNPAVSFNQEGIFSTTGSCEYADGITENITTEIKRMLTIEIPANTGMINPRFVKSWIL